MTVNENPYQAPMADLRPAVGVLSGKREDVRAVAVYQKGMLVCILVYLLAIVGRVMAAFVITTPSAALGAAIVCGLAVLAAGLGGLVFVFLLSTKVYGVAIGILLGLLTFLPCIGLLVLLIINGKATNVLRQNGHRVGLLGASLPEFDSVGQE
jgi:hypothetical protein